MSTAELEMELERRGEDTYAVRLRFSHPKDISDVRLMGGATHMIRLKAASLRSQENDPRKYGAALCGALFQTDPLKDAFRDARLAADGPLRLRLLVGPSAPELMALRWETLWDPDPQADEALLAGQKIIFSRYLASMSGILEWRPISPRPQAKPLRALVAVACPSDLSQRHPALPPIIYEDELAAARAAMASQKTGADIEVVPCRGSMSALKKALMTAPDILYLVVHGLFHKKESWLLMEDDAEGDREAGALARTPGSDLVKLIRKLDTPPRLAVLLSCQSAGTGTTGDGGVLAALGPKLAEAGLPAVVAMQGDISVPTAERLMPVFFQKLLEHAQVDQALSEARWVVSDRPDWWMPVLFSRLKSGRLWYKAGFSQSGNLDKLDALYDHVKRGKCTAILGPGLTEALLGGRDELALRWARAHGFPLSPHQRSDFAAVNEFLATFYDGGRPYQVLKETIEEEAQAQGQELDEQEVKHKTIDKLLTNLWHKTAGGRPDDPHRILARQNIPIFITTNPDNLLFEALIKEKKHPTSRFFPWSEDLLLEEEDLDDASMTLEVDVEHPLVYHLYGRLDDEFSLVLTEDDHFDFLMGISENRDLIPVKVRDALVHSSLMFLGFTSQDWEFRLLLRSLMSQKSRSLQRLQADPRRWKREQRRQERFVHIAAQMEPSEDQLLEPGRAKRYLEKYFGRDRIDIYWGPLTSFLGELDRLGGATRS